MKIQILVTTPKGEAKIFESRLRPFILGVGFKRDIYKHDTYYNKEDTQILWILDCSFRKAMKISRNLSQFNHMKNSTTNALRNKLLKNKLVRKVAKLSKEDVQKFGEMFDDTQITIIEDELKPEAFTDFVKAEA